MGFDDLGSEPYPKELFRRHALIPKKAKETKGNSTKNTDPGRNFQRKVFIAKQI